MSVCVFSVYFSFFPFCGGCKLSYYPTCYDPSWPHISQDYFRARKRRKKERKWRHRMAWIVTFASLGSRNHDVRVKHLVTQPGNAPKARPSHLTTADEVNKVSEGLKTGSFRGRRPWTETQHVFWFWKTDPWKNINPWKVFTVAAFRTETWRHFFPFLY